MASQSQKRDIADFFKPYSRSIPQKRSSPNNDDPSTSRPKKAKSPTPRTPLTISRWKDVTPSPFKSPFGPRSASSLPIRSPRPIKQSEATTYKQGLLFTAPKQGDKSVCEDDTSFSFSDLISSRQSIVEDGKIVGIRDSDGDDTDSLESLEDIFGRRVDDGNTSSSSQPDLDEAQLEAERVKTLSLFTRGRSDPLVGKDKLRSLISRDRNHRSGLDRINRLLVDHVDDQEIESKLAKAKTSYRQSALEDDFLAQHPEKEHLLASIVNPEDKGGDVLRLMDAVGRTEAFATDFTFSFFGQHNVHDENEQHSHFREFPDDVELGGIWKSDDEQSRSRAYLSGTVAEAAIRGWIEDSVLNWTFNSVVVESDDELRRASVECLRQASPFWTRTNISAEDIRSAFETLGANIDALRDGQSIEPKSYSGNNQGKREFKYLLSLLDLFRGIAADMDFPALSKLTSLLTRLALDTTLMTDGRVSNAVEETLSALLELPESESRNHVAERILFDMGKYLHQPSLQAQLLVHIPPTSLLAARLRIGLATQFLLGRNTKADGGLDSISISLPQLTKFLESPAFDITSRPNSKPVDYNEVRATTQIFDVAVGDGGRPVVFASQADEGVFNRQIDAMADRIKMIFSSIADTGASHMRRTEAKETMQALHYRLIFAVRTKPRPKKDIFGFTTSARVEAQSKGFMSKFLAQVKETEKEKVGAATATAAAAAKQELPQALPASNSSIESENSETEVLIRQQLGLDRNAWVWNRD